MNQIFVYKIRDSETRLFSSGGSEPNFSKKGKVWSNIGHIKNHLKMFKVIPSEWEVVKYEIIENELETCSAFKLNPKAISSNAAKMKDVIK